MEEPVSEGSPSSGSLLLKNYSENGDYTYPILGKKLWFIVSHLMLNILPRYGCCCPYYIIEIKRKKLIQYNSSVGRELINSILKVIGSAEPFNFLCLCLG